MAFSKEQMLYNEEELRGFQTQSWLESNFSMFNMS